MNIPLFAAVLQQVHSYALDKILLEKAKLPATSPPLPGCSYTIQKAFGLPCYHTIWKRIQNRGVILLEDIHHYWYYYRPVYSAFELSFISTVSCPIPLNPMRIQGKGRPQGALRGVSRVAESSTRRNPSS